MHVERSKRIAILGCGGFIGSHLLERILATTDYHVEGIDLYVRKIRNSIGHPRFTFHQMDISDSAAVGRIMERCSTVITLAALCNPYLYTHTPIGVIESNFVNMYPVVRMCCEQDCRLIHFSTSEVYGRTLEGYIEALRRTGNIDCKLKETETPLLLGPVHAQRWCYASAKQLLERTIFAYGFERGLDYTIIRPFNFIGPRMDFIPGIDGEGVPRVFPCFMASLLYRKPLLLVDGGNNRRCFTAISDAVDAIMLILYRPEPSRRLIFNIGNPANETTIAALAQRMIEIYGELRPEDTDCNYTIETVSSSEFYGEGYEDSDRRLPDISAISEALGWRPRIGLDEALKTSMISYIEEYGRKNGDIIGEREG